MSSRSLLSPILAGMACGGLMGSLLLGCGQETSRAPNEKLRKDEDSESREWPGKNGNLKPGFCFAPGDYPPLKGWVIISDEREVESVNNHPYAHRKVVLGPTPDPAGLIVDVYVLLDSIEDAHTVLSRFPEGSYGGPGPGYRRGSQIGLEIGDISFVEGPVAKEFAEKATSIRFSRSNIVVRLQGLPWVEVAVMEVARGIDARIKGEPDCSKAELARLLPVVSSFRVNQPTVETLSSAPIDLSVIDPLGTPVHFIFKASIGLIKRDDSVMPVLTTYYTHGTVGAAQLRVWAMDRALLLTSAETSVTVIR